MVFIPATSTKTAKSTSPLKEIKYIEILEAVIFNDIKIIHSIRIKCENLNMN